MVYVALINDFLRLAREAHFCPSALILRGLLVPPGALGVVLGPSQALDHQEHSDMSSEQEALVLFVDEVMATSQCYAVTERLHDMRGNA